MGNDSNRTQNPRNTGKSYSNASRGAINPYKTREYRSVFRTQPKDTSNTTQTTKKGNDAKALAGSRAAEESRAKKAAAEKAAAKTFTEMLEAADEAFEKERGL